RENLHASNPRLGALLEDITKSPGIAYSILADLNGNILYTSDPRDVLPRDLEFDNLPQVMFIDADEGDSRIPCLTHAYVKIIGPRQTHKLILGITDQASQRASFDGIIAQSTGVLFATVLVLPIAMWRSRV